MVEHKPVAEGKEKAKTLFDLTNKDVDRTLIRRKPKQEPSPSVPTPASASAPASSSSSSAPTLSLLHSLSLELITHFQSHAVALPSLIIVNILSKDSPTDTDNTTEDQNDSIILNMAEIVQKLSVSTAMPNQPADTVTPVINTLATTITTPAIPSTSAQPTPVNPPAAPNAKPPRKRCVNMKLAKDDGTKGQQNMHCIAWIQKNPGGFKQDFLKNYWKTLSAEDKKVHTCPNP
ncbi:hypothetical protein VNI00_016181 [Paramarasmius palmivorus]|uniref:Uncharacterized protein n=1 Tax=Paramarasmius palmivorus TaxID=297713 RepID=A0AAW0BEL7_9AGAR